MKRVLAFFLLVLILSLSACAGSSSLDRHNCSQGVCIEVRAVEPIRFGESIAATVTVTSEKDISELGVTLQYATDVTLDEAQVWESNIIGKTVWTGGVSWKIATRANQPLRFTRKIRFPPREGIFDLTAYASIPTSGPIAQDSIRIYVASTGSKIYLSGTPIPLWTPGKPIPAVTITPGPSPTPIRPTTPTRPPYP